MTGSPVPKCGSSDARNEEYEKNFSYEKYYALLLKKNNPIIFDVGAHRGESIQFFRSLFARAFNLAMSKVAATVPFYKLD